MIEDSPTTREWVAKNSGLSAMGVLSVIRLRGMGWTDERIVAAFDPEKEQSARECMRILDAQATFDWSFLV